MKGRHGAHQSMKRDANSKKECGGLKAAERYIETPGGKLENKDKYAFYMDWGFSHFSVMR